MPSVAPAAPSFPVLLLPMPDEELAEVASLATPSVSTDAAGQGLRVPEVLAWHRWHLGHQLSFCVWRLAVTALDDVLRGGGSRPDEDVACLFRAYALLLMYAGSCTPELYGSTIRPVMAGYDPAFSGTWARDFDGVFARVQAARPLLSREALRAIQTSARVHMRVADRLVPDGPSLYQVAGHSAHTGATEEERSSYDVFFHVRRQAISARTFAAQVESRAALVRADVRRRPLDVDYASVELSVLQHDAEACVDAVCALASATTRTETGVASATTRTDAPGVASAATRDPAPTIASATTRTERIER